MKRLLRQEDGFALVLALGMCVVLIISVTAIVQYTTSNGHASVGSAVTLKAQGYAEAGLQEAYSVLNAANVPGANPNSTSANLLGCLNSSPPSDCSNVSSNLLCFSFGTPSPSIPLAYCPSDPSQYTANAQTATVYGYFSGTSAQTFSGPGVANVTVAASTWLLVSTGYAERPNGTLESQTKTATVLISPLNAGGVASVWNHIFLTAPLTSNSCQANFGGNNTVLSSPLYVIGNMCLSGQNVVMEEVTGGQKIDLQVGGKLILSGSGTAVGNYSTNPVTPITSGVVVGGCNTSSVTASTSACDNGTFRYSVGTKDSFVSQSDPELTTTQIESDYSTFDPGPLHPCQSGTSPSPLTTSQLDYVVSSGEGGTSAPDNSGSGSSGGSFELTPGYSYACISQSGTGRGYLIWNNGSSSLTVSGITVPAKTLAINGSIFFDAPVTISQTASYTGTAIIMAAGTIKFMTNNQTLCAVNTSCVFTNWQGTSGNNSMLTLASLASSTTAITFVGNSVTFQGSLWTRTSSTLSFTGNNEVIQGPVSIGSFDTTVNNATFKPLPVIKNMPTGAPIPPNTSASIGPLLETR